MRSSAVTTLGATQVLRPARAMLARGFAMSRTTVPETAVDKAREARKVDGDVWLAGQVASVDANGNASVCQRGPDATLWT